MAVSGLKITVSESAREKEEPHALYILMNNETVNRRFIFADKHNQSFWFTLLDTSQPDLVNREVLLARGWQLVAEPQSGDY